MSDPTTPAALAAYWQQELNKWKDSDQSQKQFCRDNELPYQRFGYWYRKLEGGTGRRKKTRKSSGFAAVDYRPENSSGLTLSLPSGLVLRGICADNVPVVRQLLEQL